MDNQVLGQVETGELRALAGGQNIPQQPQKHEEVVINQVENGFVVRVGCKVFVFDAWQKVSEGLELYFKNPKEAIRKYCTR